jgi:hypothetical protein
MSAQSVKFELVSDKAVVHADLIGSGTFEPVDDGVRIVGRRARRRLAIGVSAAIGVVCLLAAIIGLVSLGWDRDLSNKGHLAIAFVFGLLPGMIAYELLVDLLRGGPVDLLVPWDRLKVVEVEPTNRLLRFRFGTNDLAGDVHARLPKGADVQAIAATLARASG